MKHLEQAVQADHVLVFMSRWVVSCMNCDVIDALLHCCRWVRSFLSEDHRGLDVLIDILSHTQLVMRLDAATVLCQQRYQLTIGLKCEHIDSY